MFLSISKKLGDLTFGITLVISLQIAKFKKPYSIGKEVTKPSLTAACNEVLGQSVSSKMIDIQLSNNTVERRISDTAEDTETQIIEKIKDLNFFFITTGRIYRYSEQQHITYVCTIY